jgi:hypothetical protein
MSDVMNETVMRTSPLNMMAIDASAYSWTLVDIEPENDRETGLQKIYERTDYTTSEVFRAFKWIVTVTALEPTGDLTAVKIKFKGDVPQGLEAGRRVELDGLFARFWSMNVDGQRRSGYSVSCEDVRPVASAPRTLTAYAMADSSAPIAKKNGKRNAADESVVTDAFSAPVSTDEKASAY